MIRFGTRYCVTRGPEGPSGATGPTGPAGPPGQSSTATLTFLSPLQKSGGNVVSVDDSVFVETGDTDQVVIGTKSFKQMNIGTDLQNYCLTSLFVTTTPNATTQTQIVPSDVLTWGADTAGYVEAIVCARSDAISGGPPDCNQVTCVLGLGGTVLSQLLINLVPGWQQHVITYAFVRSANPSDPTSGCLTLTATSTYADALRYSVAVTYTRVRFTFPGP
jgi:hypothetical protein